MKKINISSLLSVAVMLMCNSVLSNHALADNLSVGNKATATLAASCRINAQSISFGALALPLTAQSATSNLSVLCSKQAAYKIDMAFGLSSNYWRITSSGGAYVNQTWTAQTTLYDSTGKAINSSSFSYPQSSNGIVDSLLPTKMNCVVTADGLCHAQTGTSSNGVMIGSKDSVAYTILIPGDDSKVWSIGKNSYLGTGTGDNQSITVKAQIVPSGSAAFPAPDMYTDTVTTTITY